MSVQQSLTSNATKLIMFTIAVVHIIIKLEVIIVTCFNTQNLREFERIRIILLNSYVDMNSAC